MSTSSQDTASMNTVVADYLEEKRKLTLAAKTEELAGLRFSILLTSKWTVSESLADERRAELRTELSNLRSLYVEKIDEIAMAFGVQVAIEAKEEIEHEVFVPEEMNECVLPMDTDQLHF
jgi:hypothetical protein